MLDLANFFYLALQRGVGADVLEETWLVVDPQLLLLLHPANMSELAELWSAD